MSEPPVVLPPDEPVTTTVSEAQREDAEDLVRAHNAPVTDCSTRKPFWQCLGPGLITGAADDDPSGIGTYSVAGAQFDCLLLWLVPVCIPLVIAVQEMCGRVGRVTGKGLAAVLKQHYPKWVLYSFLLMFTGANVTNIYADLNVMAASAKMLMAGRPDLPHLRPYDSLSNFFSAQPYASCKKVPALCLLAVQSYFGESTPSVQDVSGYSTRPAAEKK